MVFQTVYDFSHFPPPGGSHFFSARGYLPRPGNALREGRMNDSALYPGWIICKLMMFQFAYGCSPFPRPEGSLLSLPEILATAGEIRFDVVG